MKKTLCKTVFMDRDGVINQDSPDYIKSWEEFIFIDGSLAALQLLTENGYDIILITNQSAINRNMVPVEELDRIFSMMQQQVTASGGRITDIFYCPHTPQEACGCRKPKPGLIQQARQRYDIRLETAVMIGDSVKDIECARNAGCGTAILVRTGNGSDAETVLNRQNRPPDHVADNLLKAVQWMLGEPASP